MGANSSKKAEEERIREEHRKQQEEYERQKEIFRLQRLEQFRKQQQAVERQRFVQEQLRLRKEAEIRLQSELKHKTAVRIDPNFFDDELNPLQEGNPIFLDLDSTHPEYRMIKRMISNPKNLVIDGVERIENTYLEKAYRLKQEQHQARFANSTERLLFHGTKAAVAGDICTYNLDWRRVREHRYGRGISFSPNSTYSSVYSDECRDKVMLVCYVLIGNSCAGNRYMEIPPEGYDTSLKEEGQDIVIVKYEDNEFYPKWKIYYHLLKENQPRITSLNNKKRYNRV